MEIIFLGMNEAGEEVLDWLRQKEDVTVTEVIETEEGLEKISELRPEIVVSSGFKHIVPEKIIEVPDKGIVNLHPSYLPYNKGAHPYIWPLIEGTPAGVSIHFMNQNLDEGPLIARKMVEKRPDDDAKSLRNRLMQEQAKLFKHNWDKILRGESRQQPGDGSIHFKKDLDDVSNLGLDKKMAVEEVINILRGLTYGDKKLARFEKDGQTYSLGVDIRKE